MSAEEIWSQWQEFLGKDASSGDEADVNETIAYGGEEQDQTDSDEDPDLDDTVAYGHGDSDDETDSDEEMAAADVAALLGQLTQANLDQAQREIDRDARAVAAAAARVQEDIIRGQVQKIDKCEGDDKPRLRRWMRDLSTLHATHADAVVTVAERTSRGNLADTIEGFLADAANAPRAGIVWPAVRDNIELLLLGEAYGEVLRSEHRVMIQKTHESTGDYSERYLHSAKSAYPEPWDAVTNQSLIALFAGGLIDRRMARDVGIVMRKPTLHETLNQARAYAGIEATMTLRDRDNNIAAVTTAEVRGAESIPTPEPVRSDVIEDTRFKRLEKQIASVSTALGEIRACTKKPPAGGAAKCYNCSRPGHFARECRGPRKGNQQARGGGHRGLGRGAARPRTSGCYECGEQGHFAHDCQVRGRGGRQQRGRGGYHATSQTYYGPQQQYDGRPPWSQRPAGGGQQQPQVAAAAEYHNSQGNW